MVEGVYKIEKSDVRESVWTKGPRVGTGPDEGWGRGGKEKGDVDLSKLYVHRREGGEDTSRKGRGGRKSYFTHYQ